MSHRDVAAILDLAAQHLGLVTIDQLRGLGVSASAASRLTSAGILEPFGTGIRRVALGDPTVHQRLLAAVWSAGPTAAVSHRGAGWLWDLDGIPDATIEVSVPAGCAKRPTGVRLHRSADLTQAFLTTVDGIPVTEPTRTLVDLASELDPNTLEVAFDSALRQGLTSVSRAERVLERLARPGRSGIGRFRRLLEARRLVDGVTDSSFETRLIQVLRRGGLPEPDRQIVLRDDDGFIGRFDCGYRRAMVVIEADSVRHHHSRERFEADRRKRTRAEAIGWRVPTFTWQQLTRQPQWVAGRTAAILDAAGWPWREPAA